MVPARRALAGSLASGLIGQAVLLVTGIIVARALGPTDRGYLALLVLVPAILQHLGTLGLPLATTYFIARDARDEARVLHNIAAPAVIQALGLTIVQGAVLLLLLDDEPQRVQTAAIASFILLPGAIADIYGKALLQGQRRYTAFNILRNATVTFYLLGVLGLVAFAEAQLVGVALVWACATLLGGGLTVGIALRSRARKSQQAGPSRRAMLRFGITGFLGSLSPVATFRLDQAVIGLFLAPRVLGLYVVGLAFTNLPAVISRGIAMIALPQVAHSSDSRYRDAWRFVMVSTALSGAVVLVLELTVGVLIPLFFGDAFADAVPITRILLVAALFDGARRVLTDSVSGSGLPALGTIAELASAAVLILLLLILTPRWGAEGVAAALAISALLSFCTLAVLYRRSTRSSATSAARG